MPRALVLLAVGLTAALPACAPNRLQLTSLDAWNIDPPRAEVMTIEPTEAVWWLDGQDRINLAVRWQSLGLPVRLLAPPGPQVLVLAYRAEQPFNGVAANLRAETKALRMIVRINGQENYFASTLGIVGVRRTGDRLTGSLRVWVGQQAYDVLLGGWSRPSPWLVQGRFEARLDPVRGAALVRELGGEPLMSAPATQPAGVPGTVPAGGPGSAPATQPGS